MDGASVQWRFAKLFAGLSVACNQHKLMKSRYTQIFLFANGSFIQKHTDGSRVKFIQFIQVRPELRCDGNNQPGNNNQVALNKVQQRHPPAIIETLFKSFTIQLSRIQNFFKAHRAVLDCSLNGCLATWLDPLQTYAKRTGKWVKLL